MPIKAVKIPGFLVEKKTKFDSSCQHSLEYNMAIDQMSHRELTLNREKLIDIIWDKFKKCTGILATEDIIDAIISNEHTLIECRDKL